MRTKPPLKTTEARRVIGYLRVSTIDQGTEKFKDDLRRLAEAKGLASIIEWVEEKVSGAKTWRKRKLGEVLPTLQAGDALLVPELSRLARSTLQILEIMQLCKEKGVQVHSVKGGWSLNGTMESKVVLHMLAMFSEIERDLISLRTKEGLEARKRAGIRLGRPPGRPAKSKLDAHADYIMGRLEMGVLQKRIAKDLGVTPGTLHNWLRKRGHRHTPRAKKK